MSSERWASALMWFTAAAFGIPALPVVVCRLQTGRPSSFFGVVGIARVVLLVLAIRHGTFTKVTTSTSELRTQGRRVR